MKKLLSLILSAIMAFSLAMPCVFADDTTTTGTDTNPVFSEFTLLKLDGTSAGGVENAPAQYKFSVDGREMVLLKSVNAGKNDGQFVTLAYPVYASWFTYYDVADNNEWDGLKKIIYDPTDEKSIAWDVNQTSFWDSKMEQGYGTSAPVIPKSIRPYLEEHIWWNEPIRNPAGTYTQEAWTTTSKVAILSYTEYRENIDRIGYNDGTSSWTIMTRTPVYDCQYYSATPQNPNIIIINKVPNNSTTEYRFYTAATPYDGDMKDYLEFNSLPIAFYLKPDVFAKVKIDFTAENKEVIKLLQTALAGRSLEELNEMGYTDDEAAILFPDMEIPPRVTQETTQAFMGNDGKTGFITTITAKNSIAINKISWKVTSGETTKILEPANQPIISLENGASMIFKVIISGLSDEKATATAIVE